MGTPAIRVGDSAVQRRPWDTPWVAVTVCAAIAACAVVLLLEAAVGDSVTIDEFAHLPAGLFYLHTGRFSVYNMSPPLLRLWCALPVWWAGADADFLRFVSEPNHWLLGYDFQARNIVRYQYLFVLGRLPTIALVVALIGVLFATARRWFGFGGGVVAAMLAAFCPNILAHGHLVTTDLGHALFFLLAVLAYERALEQPRLLTISIAGLLLGVAQLTKFTALILYPLLGLLTVIGWRNAGTRRRALGIYAASVAMSILVLNAGYLFTDSGLALSAYEFETPLLRALAASPLGRVPLPIPADCVRGFDAQMVEAHAQSTAFFHGTLSRSGWWYYYVAAFVLKTPLPLLALLVAGTATWISTGRLRTQPLRSATLFLTPLTYVTLFTMLTDVDLGLRYILAIYPFVFLIAASLWVAPWARTRLGRTVLILILTAHAASALTSRPYFLSYFNELAGGSRNGYRWLIDSNLDWGQDLLRLHDYLRAQGISRVRLTYFGRVAPEIYGIDYELIPAELTPAVYVVSASYMMGKPYYLLDHGKLFWVPKNIFADFQHYHPTTVIGGSLFVFDFRAGVPSPEAPTEQTSAVGSTPSS